MIMVFDMTDDESRTSLRAVEDWNSQMIQCSTKQDIPVILAGNKVHTYIRIYCMHSIIINASVYFYYNTTTV